MTIVANTLQIASSVICILDMNLNGGYVPIEWAVLIVGTTAMITWVNLVQYVFSSIFPSQTSAAVSE
jgi:hypothetical protein